jgi:hypothetical protein
VHLYAGRTYAKGGDHRRARREFMQVSALALQLPAHDERHDMYLEEAQEALVALDVVSGTGRTSLNLSPWTGAVPTGSLAGTIRYRLIVTGGAGERVSLHAKGVPPRWVASFCSDRLCAPFAVTLVFPESGILALEFQLVPPVSGAKVPHVVINASGGTMGRTAAAST